MGKGPNDKKGGLRERFKLRLGAHKVDHEEDTSSRASNRASNRAPANDPAHPGIATVPSVLKTQAEPETISPSEQIEQIPSRTCLWKRAADRLDQDDRERLKELVKLNQKPNHGHDLDSPAHDVDEALERARKLKEEGNQSSWGSVVQNIIKGALAFKVIGDAAVKFDKSGYAALGWSVVTFGLQVAANAGEAREFILSSSEVITRFMTKYREYELVFRGPDAGDDFDEQLTNVYKTVLLYMIALDRYLQQGRLAHIAHATLKLEDRTINLKKKAIDDADADVSHWLLIVSQKRSDNNFSQIGSLLQDLPLPRIPEPSQECLKSLAFPGMEDRFNDIERATEGTCKWLLGHQRYRDWAADGRGMLCIKGKPGSGKSTLLRYAVSDAVVASNIRDRSLSLQDEGSLGSRESAEAQFEPGALILSFFFHDRGTELQKTSLGLFRSLLHQVLSHVPDAMPDDLLATFQDRKRTMGEPGQQWHWHWRELRDFFGSSLRKALERRPVCLLIDAMDEYGKDDANKLIESFKTWLKECPPRSQLRICFTCRHHPRLALPDGVSEIKLESENEHDIAAYVHLRLSACPSSKDVAAIQTDITSRASGVFIWARLIVERVLNLQREGENWRMIREEVEQSPLELNDLYRGLIEQVADKANSYKLIQWICFAMEPLTLEELRWAMIVEPGLSYSPNSLRDYQSSKHFANDCDMMEKKLTTLSCGLIEVVPSTGAVQFIHQSVKDFFMTLGLSDLQSDQIPAVVKTNAADLEAIAHYRLSRTCIRYLSTDEIMQSWLTETRVFKFMPEFPLLRYAILHWVAHESRSENSNTPNDLLSYFGWPSEAVVQHWADASFPLGPLFAQEYYERKGSTLLHIASANRWMGPLQDIMERKEVLEFGIDARTETGSTPLHLAAREGHNDVVHLLLKNGANVDCRARRMRTPLQEAVQHHHVDVVRTLLENGSNANERDLTFGTILGAASSHGSEQIVRVLLENGAHVDGALGERSPLLAAAYWGYVDVVQVLLEKGANPNVRDEYYRTALSQASSKGHEQTVRVLVENGADVNGGSGKNYRPLTIAAFCGHGKVVKILLEHGADLTIWDPVYGCALTAAMQSSRPEREEIVRMLLDQGADMNAQCGEFAYIQSPLQMASERDSERFLQIFREYGAE